MNNPFKNVITPSIYRNTSQVKWIVVVLAGLISAASIYYTNVLVDKLRDRERRFIELYATSLESFVNERNNQAISTLTPQLILLNRSIPVIWTDGAGNPIDFRNIEIGPELSKEEKSEILQQELEEMREEHQPIRISIRSTDGAEYDYQFLYYKNSLLLTQLRFYPYVQLTVIAIFGLLSYLAFSYSRTAEQNQVWVGLAKETAHQLGTPISSLMAWMEYLRSDPELQKHDITTELEKDIHRLEMITARFSSIGSVPILNNENLHQAVKSTVSYLQRRLPSRVKFQVQALPQDIRAKVNKPLLEWVIENLSKNAVDAMSGKGVITIDIKKSSDDTVLIDFSDTGKGIPKNKINQIFKPGYTTKSRGWGLGLTLAKRIIENYHQGKIYILHSQPGKGATFRIQLNS
ncbi:MAG: sensor histidine kinase [Cyclobacteriaceae bacterium]